MQVVKNHVASIDKRLDISKIQEKPLKKKMVADVIVISKLKQNNLSWPSIGRRRRHKC